MFKNEVVGLDGLIESIKVLGKLPQRFVTKAAKAGATIAYKAAKAGAPVGETGELSKGIILRGERSRLPDKKMYDVMMDPAKNNVFVKISKDGQRSYYPVSMEFGFFTKSGSYVPGFHFLRNSIDNNADQIESTIIDVLTTEIDKEWDKGGSS